MPWAKQVSRARRHEPTTRNACFEPSGGCGVNYLGMLWNRCYRWYYRQRYKRLMVKRCSETPDQLLPGICYCLEDAGVPWAVTFKCPCGCGQPISLNLIGGRPVWKATISSQNQIQLHPSVWRTVSCRSHFWVRNGRICWVK